jgi:MerR family transcriptional regulator, light-induced transcriptional regulator
MNSMTDSPISMLTIGAVERDTGLSKDVLRVWERRYNFPKPSRDNNGERIYPTEQIERLRVIKRLMDAGYRPGKLLALSEDELSVLETRRAQTHGLSMVPDIQRQILSLIQSHDAQGLHQALAQSLMKQGLQSFTAETVAMLNRAIGEAWMRGEMQIFEEHLYTEQVIAVLRSAIAGIPRRFSEPRVLMTTFPNELHSIGLLMVESMLAPEAATVISLGTQTPIPEIVMAARAYDAQIVCLSFSGAYSPKQAVAGLKTLRETLPAETAVWVGGDLARRIRRDVEGVVVLPILEDVLTALRAWRAERFASSEAAAVVEALALKL